MITFSGKVTVHVVWRAALSRVPETVFVTRSGALLLVVGAGTCRFEVCPGGELISGLGTGAPFVAAHTCLSAQSRDQLPTPVGRARHHTGMS
jgi:hypothetical protein